MDHPFNQALATVVVGMFVYNFIVKNARSKLTAEHLFLLEKKNRFRFSTFFPLLPLIIVSITGTYFPSSRNMQLICGVIIAFLLFLINAWNSKNNVKEQGFPYGYIKAMFTAECLLALSFLIGMAIALYQLK